MGGAELEYLAVDKFHVRDEPTGQEGRGGCDDSSGYGSAYSARAPHPDGALYFNNGRSTKTGRTYLKCCAALLTSHQGISAVHPCYWNAKSKTKTKGQLGKRSSPSLPSGISTLCLCKGTYDVSTSISKNHEGWCKSHRQTNIPVRLTSRSLSECI